MAGEMTTAQVEAAARGSAMQAGALGRVADGFSPDPSWGIRFEDFKKQLDAAGHKIGGGYDHCAVCQKMAADLPGLIAQVQQQQQATQQQAKPSGQAAMPQ